MQQKLRIEQTRCQGLKVEKEKIKGHFQALIPSRVLEAEKGESAYEAKR